MSDVATSLAELAIYDLPLDEYQTRSRRLKAVSAADVQRVAAEIMRGEAMTVVVVGEGAKLAPGLGALGHGVVEEPDVLGNVVCGAAQSLNRSSPPSSLRRASSTAFSTCAAGTSTSG